MKVESFFECENAKIINQSGQFLLFISHGYGGVSISGIYVQSFTARETGILCKMLFNSKKGKNIFVHIF